jgi:hypothetical protein
VPKRWHCQKILKLFVCYIRRFEGAHRAEADAVAVISMLTFLLFWDDHAKYIKQWESMGNWKFPYLPLVLLQTTIPMQMWRIIIPILLRMKMTTNLIMGWTKYQL